MEKLVRSTLKSPPKENVYFNAMMRLIETKGPISDMNRDTLMQFCFLGVKYTVGIRRNSIHKPELKFTLTSLIEGALALLTPQELLITFPVVKKYDGHRYQTKDYLTTMKDISEYPMNKPIGEDNIIKLLWNYWNWDINEFLVEHMSIMSNLTKIHTGKGIAEQFCEDNGIETFTFHEEEGYIQSNKTGKVTKISKPKKRVPKQFKIVK